ncbi:MAG TPA: hypothetical protein ENG63_10410 [Candidatus Desulfofervidus auxilii]|uniref:Uncharacterized protein n=1 Tax=Desulfofervidus auxilii TaxID=1621989 RepID=A0A7C0YAX5_DESA2|nr:hypothetical protein [Candidatus Desulfofervidus auxilii]
MKLKKKKEVKPLNAKEISIKIYEIIKDTNEKLLAVHDDEEKRKITRSALEKMQELLKNTSEREVSSIVWNVSALLSQDFGMLIYEIMREFFQYVSCEEINKNENSLLSIFFTHFEKMQENPKCQ